VVKDEDETAYNIAGKCKNISFEKDGLFKENIPVHCSNYFVAFFQAIFGK